MLKLIQKKLLDKTVSQASMGPLRPPTAQEGPGVPGMPTLVRGPLTGRQEPALSPALPPVRPGHGVLLERTVEHHGRDARQLRDVPQLQRHEALPGLPEGSVPGRSPLSHVHGHSLSPGSPPV